MDLPFDKEKLKSLFDHVYDPGLTITEVICKLKEQGDNAGGRPIIYFGWN